MFRIRFPTRPCAIPIPDKCPHIELAALLNGLVTECLGGGFGKGFPVYKPGHLATFLGGWRLKHFQLVILKIHIRWLVLEVPQIIRI